MSSDGLGPNQVCTLFGAQGGSADLTGEAYINAAYGIFSSDEWKRCFVVLVGFFIVFQITQVIALEYFPRYGATLGVNTFAKEDAETKELNRIQRERKQKRREQANTDKIIEATKT